MKLADYVARFLAERGIRHVFAVSGGASLHLIHAVADHEGLQHICPQHEQAGAMAADAYARVTGGLGAAIATSGPGVTNMITGVCCAYYDSVPVLYLSGNVSTSRMKRDLGVRQVGFQETEAVSMYRTITNYATLVEDPSRIRYELEKACHLATSGRPGPVLIDIPDDVQRAQVDPEELESYRPGPDGSASTVDDADVDFCLESLREARRPVLIYGWGIRLAGAAAEARELAERTGVPVVPTWAVLDLLPSDHPQFVGSFGTHGTRHANFAVQNADLVLSVGCRLDTKATGSPASTFARGARRIMVDIDHAELDKFRHLGLRLDRTVRSDARAFLRALNGRLDELGPRDLSGWTGQIRKWKQQYPVCADRYDQEELLNPYVFVRELSRASREGDVLFLDTGCTIAWTMQGFQVKEGQRLFHDFNNTAMGYALPGAIAASLALDGRPVTCVTGDGSLQMNLQELATVMRHRLPLKIFLMNNNGYSMIQQTQDQWLGSRYIASSVEGGLAFPDWVKVAEAYGFPTVSLRTNREAPARIREVLEAPGPVFCNVEIASEHRVIPQCKFGRPIEDSEPLLPRDEFRENMLVPLEPASQTMD